ncbi:MAG TPA: GTPase HflX, partial [Jatrophihabitans sp.]
MTAYRRNEATAESAEDTGYAAHPGELDGSIQLDYVENADTGDLDEPDYTLGEYDLSERAALRRVAGLSTELTDITEVEYRQLRLERVVLVGVWTTGTLTEAENSMHELARLAETAGSEVLDGLVQRRDRPDPATYIGSGKAKELR